MRPRRGWWHFAGLACALSFAGPLPAQQARLLVPLVELEARAQRDSLDPVVHYELALGYWAERRFDDAERELRRSVAIESKFAPGYLGLAYLPYARQPRLWQELKRDELDPRYAETIEQSARLWRRAFILDPLVDLKVHGLAIPPRKALVVGFFANRLYVALIRGFEQFWDGQYEQAYQNLDRVVESIYKRRTKDVDDVVFWYHGLAAAHTRRFDVAVADFRLLLDRAPAREQVDSLVRGFHLESNEVRYVLANIYQRGLRPDDATPLYQETLVHDLSFYMAHAQLADIYQERNQWVEAVEERRRAVAANPEDPGLQYDLGRTLALSRDYAGAAEILQAAMAANPANTRIPYTLGQVLLLLGDRAGARTVMDRFVTLAPSRFSAQVSAIRKQIAEIPQ